MIESQNVLSQSGQTVPKQLRPMLDFVEVTQQPVIIRGFGIVAGEEYGIEYSFGGNDKWIAYSPNGSQKKLSTLFNPIALATPGRYRVVPITAVSVCARFDTITGTTSHEWLLEYQEPTVVVNNIGGASGSTTFATRAETLSGSALDLSVNPDTLAQAIQHRGYIYGLANGFANSLTATMTPPLTAYSNTSILVLSMDLDGNDSPTDPLISINGLPNVPITDRYGFVLAAGEITRRGTILLLWDVDHFVLLNPADFQGRFTAEFASSTTFVIGNTSGFFFKVNECNSEDFGSNPARLICYQGSIFFDSQAISDPVEFNLPPNLPSYLSSSVPEMVGSARSSALLNGQLTAVVPPGSSVLIIYISNGVINRPLQFNDLPLTPRVRISFSINYLADV